MTDIVFSFDTEDFTSSVSADAIVREAEILRARGIRGCFCVVGLLAKQLQNWGRTDVMEALRHHEIDLHTYGHTLHPMINEYTDIEDFGAARDEVIRQETEALRLIKDTFGTDRVYAAVPPGNSKSYAAMYAYADMGVPIYADTFCDPEDGRGSHYCNIFHMDYAYCCESDFFDGDRETLKKVLDTLAQRKRAVVYTHPNASLFDEWWDILNYDKENLCEFGQWKVCRRRPREKSEKFYENLGIFADMVQNDSRFRIVTYADVAKEIEKEPPRTVTCGDLPEIRKQLSENLFPVTTPVSLSLSDIFYACADLLCGKREHLCRKVYGFLFRPCPSPEAFTVTAEEMRKSAAAIRTDDFIPPKIPVAGKEAGPADWMMAALDILCGKTETKIVPGEQMPCPDILPKVRDCSLKGTWRHADSFEDKYLSDRLRLQMWTMRFDAQ